MKNVLTATILFVCALAVWFASRSGEIAPPAPPAPVVVCERWQDTLANRIGKSITMSDELTQILLEMHGAGDITDAELSAVNDAMPDLVHKNRALTAADAEKIKALK